MPGSAASFRRGITPRVGTSPQPAACLVPRRRRRALVGLDESKRFPRSAMPRHNLRACANARASSQEHQCRRQRRVTACGRHCLRERIRGPARADRRRARLYQCDGGAAELVERDRWFGRKLGDRAELDQALSLRLRHPSLPRLRAGLAARASDRCCRARRAARQSAARRRTDRPDISTGRESASCATCRRGRIMKGQAACAIHRRVRRRSRCDQMRRKVEVVRDPAIATIAAETVLDDGRQQARVVDTGGARQPIKPDERPRHRGQAAHHCGRLVPRPRRCAADRRGLDIGAEQRCFAPACARGTAQLNPALM